MASISIAIVAAFQQLKGGGKLMNLVNNEGKKLGFERSRLT
jgi:hypothetical protein